MDIVGYDNYLKNSGDSSSKIKVIGIVMTLFLIVGVGAGVYLSQKPQKLKSQASFTKTIQIKSPKSGSKISDITTIKANFQTSLPARQLHSVLKIDGKDPQAMTIFKLSPQEVSLSADLNTKLLTQGSHQLEIFLYNLASGKPVLIGSSSQNITVEN